MSDEENEIELAEEDELDSLDSSSIEEDYLDEEKEDEYSDFYEDSDEE